MRERHKPSKALRERYEASLAETRKKGGWNPRLAELVADVGLHKALMQSVSKEHTIGRANAIDMDLVEHSLEAIVIEFTDEFERLYGEEGRLAVAWAWTNYKKMKKAA